MRIGAHESIQRGLHLAIERALEDECEALQIFSKNQNRWRHRPYTAEEVTAWKSTWAEHPTLAVMVHDSYLINLCATDDEKLRMSRDAFIDEIERCGQLGIGGLVLHPGSHLGEGEDRGCEAVARSIDHCVEAARDGDDVRLLLENTAGQGTNLGYRLEHLRDIIAASRYPERLAVCIDTCHSFAAGYDWTTEEGYEAFLHEIDATVGLERVAAFHLNDSLKPLGSRVDRHARIGEGRIGLAPFARLVRDPRFDQTPAALETPPFDDGANSFADGVKKLVALR